MRKQAINKQTRHGPPSTMTEERRIIFFESVAELGSIRKAVKHTGFLSETRIYDLCKNDPTFKQRMEEAKLAFRIRHPERNADRQILVDATIERELKEGEVEIIEKQDPETKKVKERTVKRRFKFNPKLYEIYNPPRPFTEQAVLFVAGNQLKELTDDPAMTETDRAKLIKWLSGWMERARVDLQRAGVQTKTLDKTIQAN